MSELREYIAVDIEATGLAPSRDCIIEIGAVHFLEGETVDTFSTLVKPKCLVPERITELTGITLEMLEDAPSFSDVAESFLAFVGELPLVGHKIGFDYSFLKKEIVNVGWEFERFGVDTLTLCRRFLPAEEKKNLGAACSYLGISELGYHRALADAMSAGMVYESLKNRYLEGNVELFAPELLKYTIKREQKAQIRQKQYLIDFAKWHKIEIPVDFDSLTKSEASRLLDRWIGIYGKKR